MTDHADTIRRIAEREPEAVVLAEPASDRYNNYVLLTVEERDALLAERQQAIDERDEAFRSVTKRERELQQAIDALRAAEYQCRMEIRRAAFSIPLGARFNEPQRLAIADECRKLEDAIGAALLSLGEQE